ncbi:4-hydroxy-tetrahydrodipicolinate synthase [Silvanigrella aquatica]|uniref:4-hydroxy-tetrahydrodipicolinate synthase n=1 Tax=Silvanigrella aquatica TaxID=1915309 RepID=A0A1L4D281_9BACT|nr:4-hydroxy-tetrahydrodipicolinate synthase [Silvanigrella aquatica]APJ04315.1 4-hydroxy-tetrahydrodipicolinate synthase [Silvanigrella aquatica]
MSHKPFSGVITAIATPFHDKGEIDFKAFDSLLAYQKKAGIHGAVVLGTTGENAALSEQESEALVLAALEHQTENFHIYVGTGTNYTKTTIEKSIKYSQLKSAQGKKTNGVMVVTPYYNKPSQSCLVKHYNEVAQAVKDTPLCIYNVPSRTGINLLPQTLANIVLENENVVAIKEAAGNVNAIVEMRNALDQINKQNVLILSGDDATYAPALLCGASGVISVTSHIIPKVLIQILEAYQKGNFKELQRLHLATYCINNGIFAVPNPIGVKWMLSHLGICGKTLRAPLYPAEGKEQELLSCILDQLKKNQIQVLT